MKVGHCQGYILKKPQELLRLFFCVDELLMSEEYRLFTQLCNQQTIEITAQNQHIFDELTKKGVQFNCRGNDCHLKESIIPLSEASIRSCLSQEDNDSIGLIKVLFETDSTNRQIVSMDNDYGYTLLLAEYQNAGQGRRAKQWLSPLGENIYLSLQFSLVDSPNAHFIPLITAVSTCKALQSLGINGCLIKWPNDIFLNGKKLGGILVESRFNQVKGFNIVVGIGLNINMKVNNQIDQLWTSLINENKRYFDRNRIISALLSTMITSYKQLSDFHFDDFHKVWREMDFLYGKPINIFEENSRYTAIAHGIARDGALVVRTDAGKKNVYSADVSVKTSQLNQSEGQL